MSWPVTYDFENENQEESETLCPLPRFKRVQKIYFKDGSLFCSYHHCQRYIIDCAHIFHVLSQAKDFEEPNHHHISVRWWNMPYVEIIASFNNSCFGLLL